MFGYPELKWDKLLCIEFDGECANVQGYEPYLWTEIDEEMQAFVASLLRPGTKHIAIWFKFKEGSTQMYQDRRLNEFWVRYVKQH